MARITTLGLGRCSRRPAPLPGNEFSAQPEAQPPIERCDGRMSLPSFIWVGKLAGRSRQAACSQRVAVLLLWQARIGVSPTAASAGQCAPEGNRWNHLSSPDDLAARGLPADRPPSRRRRPGLRRNSAMARRKVSDPRYSHSGFGDQAVQQPSSWGQRIDLAGREQSLGFVVVAPSTIVTRSARPVTTIHHRRIGVSSVPRPPTFRSTPT